MSRYLSERLKSLEPYTPGEQPQDKKYVKLNTNESPFPPSPIAQRLARQTAGDLMLYPDPDVRLLCETAAARFDIPKDMIMFGNGSDEILDYAFKAFCDDDTKAVFADITYGFYKVFADINLIETKVIPLDENLKINVDDYLKVNGTIFIANPNAPTGIALMPDDIEKIVASNSDNVVVIDEAYVDFGTDSALALTKKYENLLVCRTFSKSMSLAGARLGYCIGSPKLIRDLNTVRYSSNPYNVNRVSMMLGIGAFNDWKYFEDNCEKIKANRKFTVRELQKLGFALTDSRANFVFAKNEKMSGLKIYEKLKEAGVLVRHFETDRLRDYNRITIGSREQMEILVEKLKDILELNKHTA